MVATVILRAADGGLNDRLGGFVVSICKCGGDDIHLRVPFATAHLIITFHSVWSAA